MTRAVAILFLILAFSACQLDRALPPMLYTGSAGSLFEERTPNPAMGGRAAIEASLIVEGDTVYNFFDCTEDGRIFLESASDQFVSDWQEVIFSPILTGVNLPYTFKLGNLYYTFAIKTVGNDGIYLWKSSDKVNWQLINGGSPVLSRSDDPRSIWYNIWNVAVCADPDGKIYLLAECGRQGSLTAATVGLGFSWGYLENDCLDFDQHRSQIHVLPGGGNPWMEFLPDKDAIIFACGFLQASSPFGSVWWIGAGTASLSADLYEPSSWNTDQGRFALGAPGVHVADPHLVELPTGKAGKLLMTFSFNQEYIYSAFADCSLGELYDLLQ